MVVNKDLPCLVVNFAPFNEVVVHIGKIVYKSKCAGSRTNSCGNEILQCTVQSDIMLQILIFHFQLAYIFNNETNNTATQTLIIKLQQLSDMY